MPPTAAPKLGESSKGGGGAQAPAPRHLIGRTVIIEPIRIDETTVDDDGKPRPTAHYHLTVVDGGPLQYGDNKSHNIAEQHGMTFEIQTPCRFVGVSSDRFGIVNEVRDTMARGELASVGVIQQGTRGNRPFLMTKCGRDLDGNERPDGAQRFEAATQVWNAVFAKAFVSPEPRSLVAPPAQQPPQVAYQPGAYGQPPVTGVPQQYPPNATPVYGGTAADWAASQYQPSAFAQAAAPEMVQAPANPAFEAWLATLPPEQQAAQRAAAAQGPGF